MAANSGVVGNPPSASAWLPPSPSSCPITIDGNISDFGNPIGTGANGVSYYFSADDLYFYVGVTGINLANDNFHVAFRNSAGNTTSNHWGVNFSAQPWTYLITFFGGDDICYYENTNPYNCQQVGNLWSDFGGWSGNTTSEIRIPRSYLSGSSTGTGNVEITMWANNNAGNFVWSTFPSSNPTGSANQTWNAFSTVNYPTFVSIAAPTLTQTTCAAPTGAITSNGASSGTTEYTVDNGSTWQTSNDFPNLAPGNYTLKTRLSSNPGCMATYSANPVVINDVPANPVISGSTVVQTTCTNFFGSIEVAASGSATMEYSLTPSVPTSWQSSPLFENLAPRLYRPAARFVSDTTCVVLSTNNPISIHRTLQASTTVTPAKCFGASNGKAIVTATGGVSPYSYAWSNMATVRNPSGLAAGTYTVVVTDARSCTVETSAVVSQPDAITFTVSGSGSGPITATVTAGGGVAPYTYTIDAGAYQSSNEIELPTAGRYTFRVKDANGCVKSQRLLISAAAPMEVEETELDAPSFERNEVETTPALALYPNPSSGRVVLELLGVNSAEHNLLVVHNALGQIVLQQKLYTLPQEASVLDFSQLTSGVYRVTVLRSSGERLSQMLKVSK